MRPETQAALVREIFDLLDRGPPAGGGFTRNDVRIYASPERATRERDVLFRRQPLVVGCTSELPRPGDWLADSLAPVPVLVVRQPSGDLRAFVNACRHRGSRLVDGCGRAAHGFTCPYHAWSYATDGRLTDVPDEWGFPGLDRAAHGLVELPVAERWGLVWVLPDPGATLDPAAHVDGLAADLDAYGLGQYRRIERRVLEPRIDWKLASDTFWEAYHLKVLHTRTVAKVFLRNVGVFHPFGRCHRLVGVQATIESLRGRPEAEWTLLPHATILMSLFPNTVLIAQSDHLELVRIFPAPDRPGACVVEASLLVPPGDPTTRWTHTMDLLVGVLAEDFANAETIQRNFAAGFPAEVVYGRFEGALEHFHASLRAALA